MRKILENEPLVIETVLNSLQPLNILIPERAAVRNYLINYPDMADLLPLVCKLARQRVGGETQLSLEVYCDHEIDDKHLSLYIRPEHYHEQILDMIRDIEAAYEDKVAGKSGWLLVTTDFADPK